MEFIATKYQKEQALSRIQTWEIWQVFPNYFVSSGTSQGVLSMEGHSSSPSKAGVRGVLAFSEANSAKRVFIIAGKKRRRIVCLL